jgi:hypothetical protein
MLALLWSAERPAHLRMFLLPLMGTAARPQSVLELTRIQCDLDCGLIDLNPPGRTETAKRRPVVPVADVPGRAAGGLSRPPGAQHCQDMAIGP